MEPRLILQLPSDPSLTVYKDGTVWWTFKTTGAVQALDDSFIQAYHSYLFLYLGFPETRSYYVTQADLKLMATLAGEKHKLPSFHDSALGP